MVDSFATKAHVHDALSVARVLDQELDLLGSTLSPDDPLSAVYTSAVEALRLCGQMLLFLQNALPEER